MAKRHTEKLTIKQIAKLTEPGRYGDGKGLYLQISKRVDQDEAQVVSTGRSWILRFEKAGHERSMGLGSAADLNLKEAREEARKARQLLRRDGIDPIDDRKKKRMQQATEQALVDAKDKSFKEVTEEYFKFHSPNWKNLKHAKQFLSSLRTYAFPTLGRLSAAAIDKTLVLKVLQPIWHGKNQTASRVRGRIENVLDYAKVNGWREGENPAAWSGHLEHALPAPGKVSKVNHHAALRYDEIGQFMEQLRQRQGVAARALEFLILCASRTGEVIGARWDEIDLGAATWTIPAERMKAEREHIIPLSDRALEILKALPRESDFVFIGAAKGKAISDAAMARVLKRMKRLDIVVHGFRSTFRDWAGDRSSFDTQTIEFALAHGISDKTEAAYRRTTAIEKRRKLMEAWARFCATSQRTGDVVPIRGHKVKKAPPVSFR